MRLLDHLLVRTGIINALVAATRGRLRILMYHGISPYDLQPEVFDHQLRHLRRRFDSYWASEIPELLDGGWRSSRPPVVLTFDDGLRNNLTNAAPLLEHYGIRATFYVVSDLLDGQSMLWNHELLCRVLLADDKELPEAVGPFGSERTARFLAARRFVEGVKGWQKARREELLDRLRRRTPDPSYEPWMLEKYRLMSHDELNSLPGNIEIGSHTRTHPILPGLGEEEARDEIQNSRRVLETLTGKQIRTFCYPDGQISDRDERLAEQAYVAAVSDKEGLVAPSDRRYRLRRIPAAHNTSDFLLRMVRPGAGGVPPLRMPSST